MNHEPAVFASPEGAVLTVTCSCGLTFLDIDTWGAHRLTVDPDRKIFEYLACVKCGSTLTGPHPNERGTPAALLEVHPEAADAKWSSWDCPNHGPVSWVADGGTLDLELLSA